MCLHGKRILLGVCGSIAAYKSAHLVRLLVKSGADVQVVMTHDATSFITPLTLSTLSGKPVLVDYFEPKTGEWNNHVHLALDADIVLIAPASANTLAKFAHGICDNLLGAIYLSAKSPVMVAPAMDLDMWKHPATRANVHTLQGFGNRIIPPGDGELASGLHGEGRMAEPEDIMQYIIHAFQKTTKPFDGKRVFVTAGPTREAIDPVRFISNHSSGKMGYAIAEKLYELGAEVTLISGSTNLSVPQGVAYVAVESAADMLEACLVHAAAADVMVMSAAVADYTPAEVADKKMKKSSDSISLDLMKTTDIIATLGAQKRNDQVLVGFALETDNEIPNAIQKLRKKNLDFIVLNSLQDEGAGFAGDQNKVTFIDREEQVTPYPLKLKSEVAVDICEKIATYFS